MRLKQNSKIILIILFCIFPIVVSAKVKVKLYTDPHPPAIAPNDILTLTVEVEYESENDIGKPRLPPLSPFHLVDSQMGTHVQIINGVITKKKQYKYVLRSVNEGTFKIDPITVVVDGQVYKTSSLKIEVSNRIKPRATPSPLPFGGGGGLRRLLPHFFSDKKDLFPFPQNNNIQPEDIKFKLDLEKKKVYVGEMILAEWFFYLPDKNIFNISTEILKNVDLNGFWVESVVPIGDAKDIPPKLETIDGKQYIKKLLMASALFPIRAGTLNVGSLEVKGQLISGALSLIGKPIIIQKKSNKESIEVLPLPEEGKGKFFTEAVGDFTVSASINKKVLLVQEPLIYKLSFKGEGHPRLIRLPNMNFGNSFEKYDTTESQKFTVSDSSKDFEIILIPKSTGSLKIPSFELSTFDAALGIYKTHILPSFTVNVTGVMVPKSQADKGELYFNQSNKKESEKKQEKKHKLKKEEKLIPLAEDERSSFLIRNRRNFWFAIFGLLSLFFILALKRKVFIKKNKNLFKQQIKKDLIKINKAIKNEQWKEAGIEMNQLMYSFFSELSSEDKVVKSWDILFQHIHPSIRIKYEESIRNLVSRVEKLSFASSAEAGGLRNKKNVEKLKKDLIALIQKISNEYF